MNKLLQEANWYVQQNGWLVVVLGPNNVDGQPYAYFPPGTDLKYPHEYCKRLQKGEVLAHE